MTLASENVIEEAATVTVAPMGVTPRSLPPVQEPTPAVPEPKAKRPVSEKQRMNYLAANKRRVQILAEAKESIAEYELAVRLAHKYGFAAVPLQQTMEAPVESKEAYAPTPPTPSAPPVQAAPSVLRYQTTTEKTIEKVADDASTDRVLEEANEIRLTIPRFSVDSPLGNIPKPLPDQHMFGCFIGPPRSGKTRLSTALLTQTSPSVYAGVFDAVHLFVPLTSFASMAYSPFAGHDKVYHELSKEPLERLITKLEAASKKKQK
ncbi:hypothetical protein T492DRAFT_841075 [Pavlovales sp. CCMP2436]|nr:hypothetical protein T492DRAFT_841075 [Pavlovales sp. CCMP2436]